MIGYYSQSRWSWYVHVFTTSSAQKLSQSSHPDSGRCTKALHRHPTSNFPQETYKSSDPGTVRSASGRFWAALTRNLSSRRGVLRAQVLRATAAKSPIPPHIYRSISLHLDDAFAAGKYLKDGPPKEGETPPAAPNILSDPSAMDGMMAGMKTQMVMMIPQMIIMGWINFFFQGFVLSEYLRRLNYVPPRDSSRDAAQKASTNVFSPLSDIRTPSSGLDFCKQKCPRELTKFVPHSQAPVPPDFGIQVDAATGDRDPRYGRAMGLISLLVFPQLLRSQRIVPANPRER